jgi:hypothetical protein
MQQAMAYGVWVMEQWMLLQLCSHAADRNPEKVWMLWTKTVLSPAGTELFETSQPQSQKQQQMEAARSLLLLSAWQQMSAWSYL